ncbi:hypothetical protein THOB06_140010 [Vibrio rotiferianus]|nr:hypothetical protein THOG10_140010 [Vibrio rotiferianus]CAH1564543.1 hypothetical protein THOB06_140010 [Vibrio rotiferianus]
MSISHHVSIKFRTIKQLCKCDMCIYLLSTYSTHSYELIEILISKKVLIVSKKVLTVNFSFVLLLIHGAGCFAKAPFTWEL